MQRGEEPHEHHPQGRVGVVGVGVAAGVEPHVAGADRDDDGPPGRVGRQRLALLGGVDHDHVGPAQGGAVDPAHQPVLDAAAAGQGPVLRGAGRGDQVVEGDRRAAEEAAGQPHVEVAEVADQHGVGLGAAALAAGGDRQPGPAGGQPPGQQRHPPRLAEHGHARGGGEPQRGVDLDDLVAAGTQTLDEDGHPGWRSTSNVPKASQRIRRAYRTRRAARRPARAASPRCVKGDLSRVRRPAG
ncbi:hypothetical protein Psuf_088960 [Phytohabitans suffuscus]|uniref:Uncharacterized protein n=1 Tax=Phytohabitans suffuscus TaxID=624315 RepID=A0A6F8Z013_9ACTN|nr:hypothetical protein Psuf_088960 [Phytohabitans suffuscus]